MKASEPSLDAIWDNCEDEVYAELLEPAAQLRVRRDCYRGEIIKTNNVRRQVIKMTPITMDIDDVHVTLKSIELNKQYECKCEDYQIICELKQKLSTNSSPKHLVATEVLLNVRNASTEAFPIETSCWELIDTNGFAYKAQAMCAALRSPRTIDPNSHERASPGTQVNVILLFPELQRNTQIACFAYWRRRELYLLEINKSKRTALDLVNARESLRVDARSARIEECKAYLDQLQQNVQSTLTKTLTRIESEHLAKKITKLVQAIERTLPRIKQPDKRSLEKLFQVTMTTYRQAVESAQKQAEERKNANQTLEELLRLSPSGFEEYIGDLFEARGYQRINIRGGSGDQGADILAEKDGERVAIQCKLYKKSIGAA